MASIELDYHANMVVLCQHDAIINQLGKNADVRPFSSYCSKLESVPNIYDVVVYDWLHTLETFILIVQNLLYVH